MTSITDKDIVESREILGDVATDWSDDQLKDEIVKIQCLTDSWLDEFERKTFDGKTLAEIIPGFNAYNVAEELTKNEK
jgi:predicted ATPase